MVRAWVIRMNGKIVKTLVFTLDVKKMMDAFTKTLTRRVRLGNEIMVDEAIDVHEADK